jgi:TonB family protein
MAFSRFKLLAYFAACLITLLVVSDLPATGFHLVSDTIPPPPPPPVKEPGTMWSWPQTMPYPVACDSLDGVDPFECRNELLKTIIYDNLSWPTSYRQNSVEGMAVVSFKVKEDGTLAEFEVRRSIAPLLDKEALRLVKLMAKQTSPWVPGTTGPEKKPVEVQFNMPVKFSSI